jgi:hypothetical protein
MGSRNKSSRNQIFAEEDRIDNEPMKTQARTTLLSFEYNVNVEKFSVHERT